MPFPIHFDFKNAFMYKSYAAYQCCISDDIYFTLFEGHHGGV